MSTSDDQNVRAYGVALTESDVLLVRAAATSMRPGQWWLPGGGVEFGESPEDAVRRECREETGLTITAARLLGVRSDVLVGRSGRDVHTIRIIYLVDVQPGPLAHEVNGTSDLAMWMSLAALDQSEASSTPTVNLADYTRWAIAQARGRS